MEGKEGSVRRGCGGFIGCKVGRGRREGVGARGEREEGSKEDKMQDIARLDSSNSKCKGYRAVYAVSDASSLNASALTVGALSADMPSVDMPSTNILSTSVLVCNIYFLEEE